MQAAVAATDGCGTTTRPAPSRDGAAGSSATLDRKCDSEREGVFGDESFISVSESEDRTATPVGLSPDDLRSGCATTTH
eukprot:SAG11_NODE_443_length_9422_cov_4.441382_4_plen_79_part_00